MVTLPIQDAGARLFLLTRLILIFDEGNQVITADLMRAGFTPDLVEKLRTMSLVDALRFVAHHCGLAMSVDAKVVRTQMAAVERLRADRKLYESFIHAGASPALIARLFSVSSDDVRRLRKLIAPEVACGGRPRAPDETVKAAITATWQRITKDEPSDRKAMWQLHQQFPGLPISTLENVIRPLARVGAVQRATTAPDASSPKNQRPDSASSAAAI